MASKTVSFRVSEETFAALKELADKEASPLTSVLERIVSGHLSEGGSLPQPAQGEGQSTELIADLKTRLELHRGFTEEMAQWGKGVVRAARASGAAAFILSMPTPPSPPQE